MPIVTPSEFKSVLKPGAKLLGLDISKNAIGVAFADVQTGIVTPVTVIRRKRLKEDAIHLLALITRYEAKGLVVGWPLNMDGTAGKRCQAVKDTVLEISKTLQSVKIVFQDERLTTSDAYVLVEESWDKAFRNKGKAVDDMAALLILRSFLEAIQG